MAEDTENKLNFKHWLSRTIMLAIIFSMIIYIIDQHTDWDLVFHFIVAFVIALFLGFLHEGLHYYQAVKMGYKPKWYRTRFRICFEISSHSNRKKWRKDLQVIGRLPYLIVVPLSAIILTVGVFLQQLGMIVGGVGSLIMHVFTFEKEGVEK